MLPSLDEDHLYLNSIPASAAVITDVFEAMLDRRGDLTTI